MREIEFRGLHTTIAGKRKMVYGDLIHNRKLKSSKSEFSIVSMEDGKFEVYEVNPRTIGQFINIKDKKGRKIYDGDILDIKKFKGDFIMIIEWDDYGAQFHAVGEPKVTEWGTSINKGFLSDYTVIGNIHENQKLIPIIPEEKYE
jgi:uncharacterized phage protein (TIGR01671 family)